MSSSNNSNLSIAGLENWFKTMRVGNGYGGPSIGPNGISVDYCGAAFDWRLEGLLDGYTAMYRSSGNSDYLDLISRDLHSIVSAQLLNGSFRNSWFDQNPYEGGMPYEPAMLAAACRARKTLTESNCPVPDGFDAAIERFVETRLLNELWNRLLHTFNNWLQSEFEYYTPHAVAAAIELLIDYAELRDDWVRLETYITGAADSLCAVQRSDGAIPLSSRPNSPVSPTLAARCIPALVKTAQKTGQGKYSKAAEDLSKFVRRQTFPTGGFPCLMETNRPPQQFPIILGAAADTVNSLERADLLIPEDIQTLEDLLVDRQMSSGAFQTAIGFGGFSEKQRIPDWRDVLPCCGWQDKIYSFLARHHPNKQNDFSSGSIQMKVRICGKHGHYQETSQIIQITNRQEQVIYRWNKGFKWASVNRL